tara:strand:- start:3820 stop:3945 length:126 start_codon:yes stop_codon:yes gene_type:complete
LSSNGKYGYGLPLRNMDIVGVIEHVKNMVRKIPPIFLPKKK